MLRELEIRFFVSQFHCTMKPRERVTDLPLVSQENADVACCAAVSSSIRSPIPVKRGFAVTKNTLTGIVIVANVDLSADVPQLG